MFPFKSTSTLLVVSMLLASVPTTGAISSQPPARPELVEGHSSLRTPHSALSPQSCSSPTAANGLPKSASRCAKWRSMSPEIAVRRSCRTLYKVVATDGLPTNGP